MATDGTYLDSGGRYDPASDSWLATSSVSAPAGRLYHTAAWSGVEMIVWGGNGDGTTYLNSSGRYCACPDGTLYYRDADGDGHGDPAYVESACDGAVPPGWAAEATDCDDGDPAIFAGAPEINDGQDNQCPGDPGYGVVDETSSESGFHNPQDKNEYSWPAQPGAIGYEVARADQADFAVECAIFGPISETFLVDDEPVASGGIRFYMNRSVSPNLGSWGQSSSGRERDVPCD